MKQLILILCVALTTVCALGQEAKRAGIEYKYMDTSARPGDDFADENLSFRRVLLGSAQKFPRWKMAESEVDGIMADAVGQNKDLVKRLCPLFLVSCTLHGAFDA